MPQSTRREFLKTVGGMGLAFGTQSLWKVQALGAYSEAKPAEPGPASCVRLIPEFSARDFQQPEAALWPAYFWLWNARLDSGRLRTQLADMAAHDARSVCLLPMPHGFRPDSTNNSLEPDYLTPEYFARVGEAVDEAARLGMNWWLYDEGGWPSGQALGMVVAGHPELTRRTIWREQIPADKPFDVPSEALALVVEGAETKLFRPGERWSPAQPADAAHLYRISASGAVDLHNPAATDRFLKLTHEHYAATLKKHLDSTVKFMFTDEPPAGMPQPTRNLPWFPGIEAAYEARCGRNFLSDLPKFFVEPNTQIPIETARARVALYDVLSQNFADAYFARLKNWGRRHRLASGGHLGGEDETFGAVKYSFGHLLRPFRQMDVPGVDLIWRQLFPGRERQSNFPVAAASAAHQNGTRFAFSESFCVYGNGLTPAQMKWLTDYQYLRGINLLVIGCYPFSTRDHHMTGERPHFGAMNPLWDHLPGYHAYVARLGYALSVGKPLVRTALYYPARDLWAWGLAAKDAAESYEAVGHELLARQCPFDLIDDDALVGATVERRELVVGAMRYDTVICGSVTWMQPEASRRLEEFAAAGGKVRCVEHAPGCDGTGGENRQSSFRIGSASEVAAQAAPLVELQPPNRDVRVAARELKDQCIFVLFNEGQAEYRGSLSVGHKSVAELDLITGTITRGDVGNGRASLTLAPGETRAFLFSRSRSRFATRRLNGGSGITIDPAEIRAVAGRQIVVGEHDFEIQQRTFDRVPLSQSGLWKNWLGEDFSGEVDYEFVLNVPPAWRGALLQLETGPLEYAASVLVDGVKIGTLLWPPWRVVLPKCRPGPRLITLRVANTLANELTSERVTRAWSERRGPGWPSPYHKRALEFERESRGGGLSGPVRVTRLQPP